MAPYTFLANVNLAQNQLLNFVLQKLTTAPGTPIEGLIYYNTVSKSVCVYDGTQWIDLSSGADELNGHDGAYYLSRTNHTGTQAASTVSDLKSTVVAYKLNEFAAPTAALSMGSQRITGLADPTDNQDAATRLYVLTQLASLVDSAPGTLDTLNELAAALGDDPNFATTIATSIADAKARVNHTGTQLAATISDFATAVAALLPVVSYAADVGNGSATDIVVTHGLNSRDVSVQLRTSASPYSYAQPDVEATSLTTVTLRFTTAPSTNQYRVLIHKV